MPWDSGTPSQVARGLATYHWGLRAGFTCEKWHLEFTVCQAFLGLPPERVED